MCEDLRTRLEKLHKRLEDNLKEKDLFAPLEMSCELSSEETKDICDFFDTFLYD